MFGFKIQLPAESFARAAAAGTGGDHAWRPIGRGAALFEGEASEGRREEGGGDTGSGLTRGVREPAAADTLLYNWDQSMRFGSLSFVLQRGERVAFWRRRVLALRVGRHMCWGVRLRV